ncbi:sulfotransferase [Magnetospira sp. QH-2]|uniref:sulfotransferase n=1 Tax=Magnetospira sp. (strain QH-2) TaxID=1288970 RepID=UPI0003E815DD|nr:sulfotransferase [Magnetospira sp. QH-2]CCQ74060.1 Putative sulfotransferase [Magnetospira sp. QH-2]
MLFIVGSPRSGTSWLGKIFDSHKEVIYRHEPDIVQRNRDIPNLVSKDEIPQYEGPAKQYLMELAGVKALRCVGQLPFFKKNYRGPINQALFEAAVIANRALSYIPLSYFREPRYSVPEFKQKPVGDSFLVLKTVSCLGRAPLFAAADPDLKLLHIIRHPCGYVASRMRGDKIKAMKADPFLAFFSEQDEIKNRGWTLEYLQGLSLEEQMAIGWLVYNERVVRQMDGNPNYRYIVYDRLCDDPIAKSKELFESYGLTWDEQTEGFLDQSINHSKANTRYYSVFKDPKKSANKWREELSPEAIDKIQTLLEASPLAKFFQ